MADEILDRTLPQNPAAAGQNAYREATGTAAAATPAWNIPAMARAQSAMEQQPQVQVPGAVPQQPAQPAQMPNGEQLLNILIGLGKNTLGDKEFQKNFPQLAGLQPPVLQGPDIISSISGGAPSRGGILGTGLEPIDVLTFALGAAITSRLPQDQAIATTMGLAKLPGQFRENQRKAAQNFMNDQLQALNIQVGQQNAATAAKNSETASVNQRLELIKEQQKQLFLNDVENQIMSGKEFSEEQRKVGLLRGKQYGIADESLKTLFGGKGEYMRQLEIIEGVRTEAKRLGMGDVSATLKGSAGDIKIGDPEMGSNKPAATNEMAIFVASKGKVRGPTIPESATVDEVRGALELIRENRQVLLPQAENQRVRIAGAGAEAAAGARQRVAAVKSLADLQATGMIVDQLDKLSAAIITAESAGASAKQYLQLTAGAASNRNPVAAEYSDIKDSFTENLGRSLMAAKGVMTDADVKRFAGVLPKFGDLKSVRDNKIARLKSLIQNAAEVEAILAEGGQIPAEKVRQFKARLWEDPNKPAKWASAPAASGERKPGSVYTNEKGERTVAGYETGTPPPPGSVPAKPTSTVKELPKDF